MTKKTTTEIQLGDKVWLSISGSYYGGYIGSMEDPPEEPEFEIESIRLVTGELIELLDELDAKRKGNQTINELLSEMACDKINEHDN